MNKANEAELVATGLGWPEGPTLQSDGSIVFVESYRSQLTVYRDGTLSQLASTAGST
jgi:gluconolactonase